MGTVTVFTAARMLAIEAASIVSGAVNGSGRLILTKHDGGTVDAGYVVGPQGPTGPSGSVIAFAGSAAPSGWLLCDGSSVLRADYAALFAVIGTTYGSVDGTHFTLPNLKGRMPVGLDSAQTEFDALAETGGAKTHALATTEIPSHAHTMKNHTHSGTSGNDSPDHSHSGNTNGASNNHTHQMAGGNNKFTTNANGSWASYVYEGGGALGNTQGHSADHSHAFGTGGASARHTHSLTTGAPSDNTSDTAGGGGAHNNLQPYIVMNYIIKT